MVGRDGVVHAANIYSSRFSEKAHTAKKFDPDQYVDPAEFRFFKVKVTRIYIHADGQTVELE